MKQTRQFEGYDYPLRPVSEVYGWRRAVGKPN